MLILNLGGLKVSANTEHLDEPDFETDELVIQYKAPSMNLDDAEKLEDSEDFIAKLGINYHAWNDIDSDERLDLLQDKIKKAKKNHKYKKLKKLKKLKRSMKSNVAVLKLDEKLSKKELKRLARRMSLEHYHDDVYEIEAAYPNYLYEISEVDASVADSRRAEQWSLDIVQPDKTWQITEGEGAVVAVIDTGVDLEHEDLRENIWINEDEIPGNGIDDDKNGYIDDYRGWDFVKKAGFSCISSEDCSKEDNNPSDINGHGTHVAGIIAAVRNNGKGIAGIAPKAKIMALRAGYSSGFSAFLKTADILDAITYAINNEADVINMSFAGYSLSVLEDILDLADSLGVVNIAAAGNNASTTRIYPAAIDSVVSVGATADGDSKAYFSNAGDWVDIVAPGAWILSTIPGNNYGNKSGTSMAAPIVAGVAALIKAKNKVREISASEVKDILYSSTRQTSFRQSPNNELTLGGVSANIDFPFEIDTFNVPNQTVFGSLTNFSASASGSDSAIVSYEWESDRDGFLSDDDNFQTPNLSEGLHTITVTAYNASGQASQSVSKTINVSGGRAVSTASFSDKIRFRIKKRTAKNRVFAKVNKKGKKKVRGYQWVSSRDGAISSSKGFYLSQLSAGYHQLSLRVLDKSGVWSEPIETIVQR